MKTGKLLGDKTGLALGDLDRKKEGTADGIEVGSTVGKYVVIFVILTKKLALHALFKKQPCCRKRVRHSPPNGIVYINSEQKPQSPSSLDATN